VRKGPQHCLRISKPSFIWFGCWNGLNILECCVVPLLKDLGGAELQRLSSKSKWKESERHLGKWRKRSHLRKKQPQIWGGNEHHGLRADRSSERYLNVKGSSEPAQGELKRSRGRTKTPLPSHLVQLLGGDLTPARGFQWESKQFRRLKSVHPSPTLGSPN